MNKPLSEIYKKGGISNSISLCFKLLIIYWLVTLRESLPFSHPKFKQPMVFLELYSPYKYENFKRFYPT